MEHLFIWQSWYLYIVIAVVLVLFLLVFMKNYVKVPPNVALFVSGRKHSYKVKDEN